MQQRLALLGPHIDEGIVKNEANRCGCKMFVKTNVEVIALSRLDVTAHLLTMKKV